jgi:hypothetical protein
VLLLAFLGRSIRYWAALLGGIGFGTFIDELGKFVTSDNNYFFQPTIAAIYILFVLLFVAFRVLNRHRALTPQECLANAVAVLQEAVLGRTTRLQRQRALRLLDQSGIQDPLVESVRLTLARIDAAPAQPSPLARVVAEARKLLGDAARQPWFQRVVVGVFVLHALAAVIAVVVLIVSDAEFTITVPGIDVAEAGQAIGTFLVTVLVLIGVLRLPRAPLAAYGWFKRSVLVSIFLVQVFVFYSEQLLALGGLFVDVILLVGLNVMIDQGQRAAQSPALVERQTPGTR